MLQHATLFIISSVPSMLWDFFQVFISWFTLLNHLKKEQRGTEWELITHLILRCLENGLD